MLLLETNRPLPPIYFWGLSLYRRTEISVSLKHMWKQESPGAAERVVSLPSFEC